jgi:Icc-related predicted phosphoesterase
VGLFSKAKPKARQVLFVTDLHGSTVAFRKMLASPKVYGVDALICGGDVAGKRLCPIVEIRDGRYVLHSGSTATDLDGHAALADAKAKLEAAGAYPALLSAEAYEAMKGDEAAGERLFTDLVKARLEEWIALAEDRLAGTDVRCYITGGNDDTDEMLEPLTESGSERVIASEGRVVDVLGHPMVSLGWSNPTPWGTPRETTEDALATMLSDAIGALDDTADAIYNFHVPPKDSTLDTCPRLDTSVWPPAPVLRGGEPELHGAGSTAVAAAIRETQPLVTLHGHIHESTGVTRIGRTVSINPGSEYQDAALLGAIVALAPGKVVNYQLTRG